jgi:hypothetical protein
MSFRTKLDFSSNRQVKQYEKLFTALSGGTQFGMPYSALTTGPDLTTTGITQTYTNLVSTFSGNSGTTIFTWYDPNMALGQPYLSAITPSTSATTQFVGPIFTGSTTGVTQDGYTYKTAYSGISFDLVGLAMISLSGGSYSGSVHTNNLTYYSAGTLDYSGRTIWVDVSGITRTEKLIITNVGAGPATIDIGVDANGNVVNTASDIQLKEDIITINSALDKVKNLRGVYFKWKDKEAGGSDRKIGFIAQEVEEVVPELVYTHNNGLKVVNYKDVVALLTEAIKELTTSGVSVSNTNLETQSVIAEDNNIDLNFGGNQETAIEGGIRVLHALGVGKPAEFIIDSDGNWTTNNDFKPKGITIPTYTPSGSTDTNGSIGNLTIDENYLYVKAESGWRRSNLESF